MARTARSTSALTVALNTDTDRTMSRTHGQKEYPIPVGEQTLLDEPIKVKWDQSQATHTRMVSSINSLFEDANEDEPLIGCGLRAMTRQKTQLVVKTVEEATCIIHEIESQYLDLYGLDAPGGRTDVYERIRDELMTELEQRGWFIEEAEFGRPEVSQE